MIERGTSSESEDISPGTIMCPTRTTSIAIDAGDPGETVYHAGVTAPFFLCAWLILTLAVFAFEGARHSVHHLGSPDNGCPMASAAADLSVLNPDSVIVTRATPNPIGSVPGFDIPLLSSRPWGHHQGRAPPASASSA